MPGQRSIRAPKNSTFVYFWPSKVLADLLVFDFSSFYRNHNGEAYLKSHGFMIEWAKRAGKLVFQNAEDLHDDNIVTFSILGLFWYGQGSWRLCYLHKRMIDLLLRCPSPCHLISSQKMLAACYISEALGPQSFIHRTRCNPKYAVVDSGPVI